MASANGFGLPLNPRRPPRALVLRDLSPEEASAAIDWSGWYLPDDAERPGKAERSGIVRLLLSVLSQLVRERGWADWYAGADHAFAWVRGEPLVRVVPDLYVLDHRPLPPLPRQWQMWLPSHRPPRFALEIVAGDWRRVYEDAPAKYWQLGCPELLIFDPEAAAARAPLAEERVPLQLYRRRQDGTYLRVHAGADPLRVEAFDAYVVVLKDGPYPTLRVARSARATDLVPAEEEALRAEGEARAQEQRARVAEQRARAAAEARVRELEAKVRDLEARVSRR
ncbi:Uma2 family endonuclease [Sorangium sp. So ce1024]|uniref:Uma2 family endonuclease n=1 Tax=Sorangium sp. So ce1024 TaxID=3133327 RepID=UPI003EFE574C